MIPRNDRFYVQTNENSPRSRLFEVDPLHPLPRDKWKEVIPEGKDVLENVAVVGDVIVGQYMEKASSRLRLFDRDGKLLARSPVADAWERSPAWAPRTTATNCCSASSRSRGRRASTGST